MANVKEWKTKSLKNGIWTVQFSSWKYFHDYITQEMLDYSEYVWRGDRCDNRPLLPSFDRSQKSRKRITIERRMAKHLKMFKSSTLGRRGLNPLKIDLENDWWSLGQHYRLNTPLLDWTNSAFVALFFAFEKKKSPQTQNRAIYAITPEDCEQMSYKISKNHRGNQRADIVEFIQPQLDENSRLISQGGLFSRCTAGKPLEDWVAEHFEGHDDEGIMLKLLIPNSGRLDCLRTLNKMNINYLTLFPDLSGASRHANTVNTISKY